MCQRNDAPNNFNMSPAAPLSPPEQQEDCADDEGDEYDEDDDEEEEIDEDAKTKNAAIPSAWDQFVQQIKQLEDPLLMSILNKEAFLDLIPKAGV